MGISLGADEEYIPLRSIPEFFNREYLYPAYSDPHAAHARALQESPDAGKLFSFRRRADLCSAVSAVLFNLPRPGIHRAYGLLIKRARYRPGKAIY